MNPPEYILCVFVTLLSRLFNQFQNETQNTPNPHLFRTTKFSKTLSFENWLPSFICTRLYWHEWVPFIIIDGATNMLIFIPFQKPNRLKGLILCLSLDLNLTIIFNLKIFKPEIDEKWEFKNYLSILTWFCITNL